MLRHVSALILTYYRTTYLKDFNHNVNTSYITSRSQLVGVYVLFCKDKRYKQNVPTLSCLRSNGSAMPLQLYFDPWGYWRL
jgi:hypothetical protein